MGKPWRNGPGSGWEPCWERKHPFLDFRVPEARVGSYPLSASPEKGGVRAKELLGLS